MYKKDTSLLKRYKLNLYKPFGGPRRDQAITQTYAELRIEERDYKTHVNEENSALKRETIKTAVR